MVNNIFFIGIVLNPKTLEPCPVYKTRKRSVVIYTSAGVEEGDGYFDHGDHGAEYAASESSGYPRVHTAKGVRTQKQGYGTVLYTGLCLAAHLKFDDTLRSLDVSTDGDGISSNSKRTPPAEAWWTRAKELGLAEEVEVDTPVDDVEEDFEESLSSRRELNRGIRTYGSQISDILQEYYDNQGDGKSVTSFSIDVEGTESVPGDNSDFSPTADVYTWENAKQFVPLSCALEAPNSLFWGVGEPDAKDIAKNILEVESEIDSDIFASMNVSNMHPKLRKILEAIAIQSGMKAQWEEVMFRAVVGKKLEDVDVDLAELYASYHPLRLNPAAASKLTKEELNVLSKQVARVKRLGLDKFMDFDD